MKKFKNGFTLVELLVVVSIISLLAAIILSSINTGRAKARDAKRLEDKHQVVTALHLYNNTFGVWPNSAGGGTDLSCLAPSAETCWTGGLTFGLDSLVTDIKPYISTLPTTGADPGNAAYNRLVFQTNVTANFFAPNQPAGAYLIWAQEKPIPAGSCPSSVAPTHPDKYYYCYEYLGPK